MIITCFVQKLRLLQSFFCYFGNRLKLFIKQKNYLKFVCFLPKIEITSSFFFLRIDRSNQDHEERCS